MYRPMLVSTFDFTQGPYKHNNNVTVSTVKVDWGKISLAAPES